MAAKKPAPGRKSRPRKAAKAGPQLEWPPLNGLVMAEAMRRHGAPGRNSRAPNRESLAEVIVAEVERVVPEKNRERIVALVRATLELLGPEALERLAVSPADSAYLLASAATLRVGRSNRAKGRRSQASQQRSADVDAFRTRVWPRLAETYGKRGWPDRASELCRENGLAADVRTIQRWLETLRLEGLVPTLRHRRALSPAT